MKRHQLTRRVLGAICGLLVAPWASAALVTQSGTNVDFTYDDTLLGLFGSPTVSGDTIFFTPVDFKAVSTNGSGVVITSSTVNVQVVPKGNNNLAELLLVERGDYTLSGDGSSVQIGGQLRAFDIDNSLFVADSDFITTSSDLTINDGAFHDWEARAGLDLTTPLWADTRRINMTIENVLIATTIDFPSLAFIEKKFAGVGITVGTTPVGEIPLPPAVLPFLTGLIALWARGRRGSPSASSGRGNA